MLNRYVVDALRRVDGVKLKEQPLGSDPKMAQQHAAAGAAVCFDPKSGICRADGGRKPDQCGCGGAVQRIAVEEAEKADRRTAAADTQPEHHPENSGVFRGVDGEFRLACCL